jgi:hypothetical protein
MRLFMSRRDERPRLDPWLSDKSGDPRERNTSRVQKAKITLPFQREDVVMKGNFPMRMQFGYGEAAGAWGRVGNILTDLVIGPLSPRFRLSSASPIHYHGLLHADLAMRYLEVAINSNVISCQRIPESRSGGTNSIGQKPTRSLVATDSLCGPRRARLVAPRTRRESQIDYGPGRMQ